MKPDLGRHLWRHVPGARSRMLVVMPVYPRAVAEAPGGTVDVSFLYYRDDDDFEASLSGVMGTLNTRQTVDKLLAMIGPDEPMAVVGTLARSTVTGLGQGGVRETYRLILGRLASLPDVPARSAA